MNIHMALSTSMSHKRRVNNDEYFKAGDILIRIINFLCVKIKKMIMIIIFNM